MFPEQPAQEKQWYDQDTKGKYDSDTYLGVLSVELRQLLELHGLSCSILKRPQKQQMAFPLVS